MVVACGMALAAGCAKKHPGARAARSAPAAVKPAPPMTREQVASFDGTEGIASWYGVPYDGRAAADGEIYHMEQLVAAHRTLPFGTRVKVTNLSNGQSVEVRVIDRGPFVEGRIIDLSKEAAREIGMLGPGTAKVRLNVLSAPADAGPSLFAVQVGAFQDKGRAERMRAKMESEYGAARLQERQSDPVMWRVLVGEARNMDEAYTLASRLRVETGQAFVVSLEGITGAGTGAADPPQQ